MVALNKTDRFLRDLKGKCPNLIKVVPEAELRWFVDHIPAPQKQELYSLSEAAEILGKTKSTLNRWANEYGGMFVPQTDDNGNYVMQSKQIDLIVAVKSGTMAQSEADEEWQMFLDINSKKKITELPRRRQRKANHA